MTDTRERSDYVIDITGDVTGMVAAGEHVYQQQVNVKDGGLVYVLESGAAPFRRISTPVRSVPRAEPPLIGRRAELGAVTAAVRPGGTVQIVGQTGIGKTTLLTHSAHRDLSPELVDGIVHIRARGKALDDVLVDLFYSFHDSALPTPFVPPAQQIHRLLQDTKAAILIDDVDESAYEVGALLDSAASAAFVITADEPAGSVVQTVRLEGLSTSEAVELLVRELDGAEADPTELASLCERLDGHPDCVLLAARHVSQSGIAPGQLMEELDSEDPCGELARRVVGSLTSEAESVGKVLAALNGAPASVDQISSAVGFDAGPALAGLEKSGGAFSNSPIFYLNPLLVLAAEQLWDLDALRGELVSWFLDRLNKPMDEDEDRRRRWVGIAVELINWAESVGQHDEVISMGQAIDSVASLSGRWGAWLRALRVVEKSAQALGRNEELAWSLHQQGSRALCLGNHPEAERLLGNALDLRIEAGLASAVEATKHNLDVLRLPPGLGAGNGGSGPTPTPTPFLKTLGILAVGAVVGVGGWLGIRALASGSGELEVEPTEVVFEDVVEGESASRQIFLSNQGGGQLEVLRVSTEGDRAFGVESECGVDPILEPDTACTATVLFDASDPGTFQGSLIIEVSGGEDVIRIPLAGRALAMGRLVANQSEIDFGIVDAGTSSEEIVEFNNPGEVPVTVSSLHVGAGSSFSIVDDSCEAELGPGSSCAAAIRFIPNIEGDYADTLLIEHGGDEGLLEVGLRGMGVGEAEIVAEPGALDLGEFFVVDDGRDTPIVLRNEGRGATVLSVDLAVGERFELSGNSCDFTLEVGQECVVTVSFVPLSIEEALPDFVREATSESLLQLSVLSADNRYSDALTVVSQDEQILEIPVTGVAVLPLSDLGVEIGEITAEGFDDNGFPVYRVSVLVNNAGREEVSSGEIWIEARIDDYEASFLIPLVVVPEEEIEGQFLAAGAESVPPGPPVLVEGVAVVPLEGMAVGTVIQLTAKVDECDRSRLGDFCRVFELNELNNGSKAREITVPWFYATLIPFPLDFVIPIFVFPSTTVDPVD